MFWEHAKALIGIPSAIKATIDIISLIRSNPNTPQDPNVPLSRILSGLDQFAQDAFALEAFKALHTTTNTLFTDLRQTFTIAIPDRRKARERYEESYNFIELEFSTLWEGQRSGDRLDRLKNTPALMGFLQTFPSTVLEAVKTPPWEDYFSTLLYEAHNEVENFKNFYDHISDLRRLNLALNNYADFMLASGIDEFNDIMEQLRRELGRSHDPHP